jgi:hypothetical protein
MDISIKLFARDEGFLINFGCSFSWYRRAEIRHLLSAVIALGASFVGMATSRRAG